MLGETPCETSFHGAAAQRLPGGLEEGRGQGKGGERQRDETPRRELEKRWGEKRSSEEDERRNREGGGRQTALLVAQRKRKMKLANP